MEVTDKELQTLIAKGVEEGIKNASGRKRSHAYMLLNREISASIWTFKSPISASVADFFKMAVKLKLHISGNGLYSLSMEKLPEALKVVDELRQYIAPHTSLEDVDGYYAWLHIQNPHKIAEE